MGARHLDSERAEPLARCLAGCLPKRLGQRAVLVTAGRPGVAAAFARHCGAAAPLFHLLPVGERSGLAHGVDVHAGADRAEMRQVLGRLGDIYVAVGGGGEGAEDARRRGALVLPLARGGPRPPCVPAELWEVMADSGAPAQRAAEAVAEAVARHIGRLEQGDPYNMELIQILFERRRERCVCVCVCMGACNRGS